MFFNQWYRFYWDLPYKQISMYEAGRYFLSHKAVVKRKKHKRFYRR